MWLRASIRCGHWTDHPQGPWWARFWHLIFCSGHPQPDRCGSTALLAQLNQLSDLFLLYTAQMLVSLPAWVSFQSFAHLHKHLQMSTCTQSLWQGVPNVMNTLWKIRLNDSQWTKKLKSKKRCRKKVYMCLTGSGRQMGASRRVPKPKVTHCYATVSTQRPIQKGSIRPRGHAGQLLNKVKQQLSVEQQFYLPQLPIKT